MKQIVSRMSNYFPNRWPLSYLNLRGPPRGFGDSGRRAIKFYFQRFGEKGHLFLGIWGESIVLGSREQGAEEKTF